MKRVLIRDNLRALRVINPKPKPVQSQSPPHRHFIKKVQLKHPTSNKFDLSLQENLLIQDTQPETFDFRIEIERRFLKCESNQTYTFPLKNKRNDDSDDESECSDGSAESLRHVTIYDLHSQNNRTKRVRAPERSSHVESIPNAKLHNVSDEDQQTTTLEVTKDIKSEQTHVREMNTGAEKNPQAYKKLVQILDSQWSTIRDSTKRTNSSYQQNKIHRKLAASSAQRSELQEKIMTYNTLLNTKVSEKLMTSYAAICSTQASQMNTEKAKSQERYEKDNSFRISKEQYTQPFIKSYKNLSREFTPSVDTSSFALEKSFKNVLSSSTKSFTTEASNFRQENLKKIYSNTLFKTPTPRSIRSVIRAKDSVMKICLDRRDLKPQTEPDSLYKKAQNEILSEKIKAATRNTQESSSIVIATLLSSINKEEEPKGHVKRPTLTFYAPQSEVTTLYSTPQAKMSGRNSVKMTRAGSPTDNKREKQVGASFEFDREMLVKKAPFKLDLNRRTLEKRDFPSSTRSRNKISADKRSDRVNNDSTLRRSHENTQRSSFGVIPTYKRRAHERSSTHGLKIFSRINLAAQINSVMN